MQQSVHSHYFGSCMHLNDVGLTFLRRSVCESRLTRQALRAAPKRNKLQTHNNREALGQGRSYIVGH